jgi:Fic family protein
MRELVEWLRAEAEIHPVLVAGIAQFQLVHIHPFVDGNGRSSRLLSMLCLYRAGYDFKRLFTLSEFYDRDRRPFYTALQSVREHGMDMTGWLEYFTHGLAVQLDEVKLRGTAIIKADVVALSHGLTARQSAVLGEIFAAGRLSLGDLDPRFPDVGRRSLQRDLKALLEQGLIEELAAAPTDPNRRYAPARGAEIVIPSPDGRRCALVDRSQQLGLANGETDCPASRQHAAHLENKPLQLGRIEPCNPVEQFVQVDVDL